MATPVSKDIREKIVASLLEGKSYGVIATNHNISKQSVADIAHLYVETGSITPRTGTRGPMNNKLEPFKPWIEAFIKDHPNWSLQKMANALYDNHGLTVNRVSLWRFMKRQGIDH